MPARSGFLFLCDSALLIFCARNGWFSLGKKLETLLTTLPLAADIVWVLVLGASWFARQLAIVLDPHSYIDGHGYRTVVLRELLQNAKFIGQGGVGPYSAQHLARSEGFGMVDLQAHALTLLVHRCGWLALIALVTLLTALLVLAFRRCRRQESTLARLVSYSVLLSFTTQRPLSLLRPHADPHQRRCSLPVFHLWHQDDPAQHATARFSALHAARRQRRTRQGCCCRAGAAQAALTHKLFMGKRLSPRRARRNSSAAGAARIKGAILSRERMPLRPPREREGSSPRPPTLAVSILKSCSACGIGCSVHGFA